MNATISHDHLLEALDFECAWRTQRVTGHKTYEARLLALLPDIQTPWWRRHEAIPAAGEGGTAIPSLRQALEHATASGTPVLAGTLELQKIARAALRMGAWQLLGAVMRTLLYQLRAQCATPQRMSQACGLVAEWALAGLRSREAFIYCHESLAWGGEPHRIRSYLAYAQTSLEATGTRDKIDLLLSTEATERQESLTGRRPFGNLHAFRLRCLQAASQQIPCPEQEEWMHAGERKTAAHHLAICAAWATQCVVSPSGEQPAPETALTFLRTSGRWRDWFLLSGAAPGACPAPRAEEQAFVGQVDALVDTLPRPPALTPDSLYLDELPHSLPPPTPHDCLKAFLCCI